MLALGILKTNLLCMLQYVRYWWNEMRYSSTMITFDRFYINMWPWVCWSTPIGHIRSLNLLDCLSLFPQHTYVISLWQPWFSRSLSTKYNFALRITQNDWSSKFEASYTDWSIVCSTRENLAFHCQAMGSEVSLMEPPKSPQKPADLRRSHLEFQGDWVKKT